MIFIQCIILLLQLTSPSWTVRNLFCLYGGNHCQKKTVTYASVWLMSEKLETAMKYFIEEFIWLAFFFFLKIGHILFHYVNKLLRLTWGAYFIGSLPAFFFHWALIYPEEWSMCTHTETIWTKTNSAWKRHNAGEGSSSHHYFFLCCFFEFEQATPGQKLYPLVSFFFLFFFFSRFSKTLRWKTYVAYFKSGRKRGRWTHSLWQLQGVFELHFEYLQSFGFFWSSRFFPLCI